MIKLELLEQLASTAHHRLNLDKLLSEQPEIIKKAILENDAQSFKMQFKDAEYLADFTEVFQV